MLKFLYFYYCGLCVFEDFNYNLNKIIYLYYLRRFYIFFSLFVLMVCENFLILIIFDNLIIIKKIIKSLVYIYF